MFLQYFAVFRGECFRFWWFWVLENLKVDDAHYIIILQKSHFEQEKELCNLIAKDYNVKIIEEQIDALEKQKEEESKQNSFHEVDTYTSLEKQYRMLKLVILFKKEAERALEAGVYLNDILNLEVRDKVARAKYIEEKDIKRTDEIAAEVKAAIDELISKGGVLNA